MSPFCFCRPPPGLSGSTMCVEPTRTARTRRDPSAQLAFGAIFELTRSLTRDPEAAPNVGQRKLSLAVREKSVLDDVTLARIEDGQGVAHRCQCVATEFAGKRLLLQVRVGA